MLESDDAWAVGGYWDAQGSAMRALALHWDGSYWTPRTVPDQLSVPLTASLCLATMTFGPTGVWRVDALRWDGLEQVPLPAPGIGVLAMAALGAADMWAVGTTYGQAGALFIHWDGATWTSYHNLADCLRGRRCHSRT